MFIQPKWTTIFYFLIHTCIISRKLLVLFNIINRRKNCSFISFFLFLWVFFFFFLQTKMEMESFSRVRGGTFVWWNIMKCKMQCRYYFAKFHTCWMFILIKIEYHLLLHLIFLFFSLIFKWVFLLFYTLLKALFHSEL